jgi:hypothetical protein
MHLDGVKVTTEILWRAAVLFALFDTVLVAYLARFIQPQLFRELRWPVTAVTGILWFLIWLIMVSVFWEPVYHYVFPSWSRWIIPPVYGVFFALAGLLFWWLASRLPGNPVVSLCLLGGLWGTITHIWAIHRGILDKPPLLQEAGSAAVSIMPFFEFVFYWCIILGVAFSWQKRKKLK